MIAVRDTWDEMLEHSTAMERSGSDPATEVPAGTVIGGRYRLDEIIGRGGMATVYRGHDERLARDVAVKVCAPCDSQLPPLREERVSSALLHNNVVSIFDAGEIPAEEPGAGCSFIVMEYVHGTTAQAIAPVPWQRALDIVRQAADGLAAAHARGIVHCDVKPSNLLLDDRDRVLVADFGVAAEAESEVGDFVHGSPAYIAPERLRGERPDPRVDVFGLGGVLAFLITGQKPPADRIPTLPPGTPDEVTQLIARARSLDPAERQKHAAEFRDAVEEVLGDSEHGHDVLLHTRASASTRPVSVARPAPAATQPVSSPRRVVRRAQPSTPARAPRASTGTSVLPAQPVRSGPPSPPRVSLPPKPTQPARGLARPVVLAAGVVVALLTIAVLTTVLRDGVSLDPSGAAIAASEMPDVRGLTFGPAVEQLAAQGIVVDRVDIVYADNYLNEVVVQSPAPGEDVTDDDVVTLVVRTSR